MPFKVLITYGRRFAGTPVGYSPIIPLGCAQIGLKYLREHTRNGVD